MRKKMNCMVLAMVLIISAIATTACGQKNVDENVTKENVTKENDTQINKNDDVEEMPTIVYSWMHMNKTIDDDALQDVEDALNKIVEPKIGAHIKLYPIDIGNYVNTVELALMADEQIDLLTYWPDYAAGVSKNLLMDITDIVEEYAPTAIEKTGEDFMKCVEIDGRIYGVPCDKGSALKPCLVYRSDLAEEANIDMSKVKSLSDLTDVFRQFKEAYPDMYPLYAGPADGNIIMTLKEAGLDKLGDETGACLIGDGQKTLKVSNLYASDEFRDLCYLMQEWYEAGYISPDASTTTLDGRSAIASGNYWAYEGLNAGNYFANEASMNIGYPMDFVQTARTFLGSTDGAHVVWSVSSNCKNPEKALQFLDLTYSDEEVVNLILYGIEGRDYVLNEEGFVEWPEGYDINTVPYTSQYACGVVGSQYIQYELAGTPSDNKEVMAYDDENSDRSVALGFRFESKGYETEITMISNVINQYLSGLMGGIVDVDATLKEFNDALNDAGMQTIIDAKQEQLDEWIVAQ